MKQQSGAVLVLSLIFLLLLGLIGVSAVKMAGYESRIASSFLDHQAAKNAAEAALVAGETLAQSIGFKASRMVSSCDPSIPNNLCFTSSCNNGLCFTGSYDGTKTVASEVCVLPNVAPANEVYQSSSVWSQAKTVDVDLNGIQTRGRYLIEFRCFVLKPGVNRTDAFANPPPSSYWAPQFKIISRATGRTDESEIMLQSYFQPRKTPSLPAIFATNKTLTNYDSSSIDAFYCEHCTSADIAAGDPNNLVTIDPNESPAIAFGEPDLAPVETGWDSGSQHMGGKLDNAYLDAPVPIDQKTPDDFLAQYFTQSRDDIKNNADLVITNANDFINTDFSTVTDADGNIISEPIIYVQGPIDLAGVVANSFNLGNANAKVYVDGDLLMGTPYVSSTVLTHKMGLLYVAGNMVSSGSMHFFGALAVEGDATVYNSLNLTPLTNPVKGNGGGAMAERGRKAWSEVERLF